MVQCRRTLTTSADSGIRIKQEKDEETGDHHCFMFLVAVVLVSVFFFLLFNWPPVMRDPPRPLVQWFSAEEH